MTDDPRPSAASSLLPSPTSSSVRRLPELTRKAMWTTAVVIAVLTAAAVTVLWWPATAGLTGADLVKARLDALKIGLSVGVGSGGVVALYLAWRRQHSTEADLDNRERALIQQYEVFAHQQEVATTTRAHQEQVAADARADAAARRITELYTKAVEQLGSDKAPVRLGGLYALERLAQDNEDQRQTIVNVLCAYLRMPYEVPELPETPADDANERERHRALVQEREVRLTAQRLLSDHLKPDHAATCWGPLNLDLTGAQLINFDLEDTAIGTSTFSKATFIGRAAFTGATFTGEADFTTARFTTRSVFTRANFISEAWFGTAAFDGDAIFDNTAFREHASFHDATFARMARFGLSTFKEVTVFSDAAFIGKSAFVGAIFSNDTVFDSTSFTNLAEFDGATFDGITSFSETDFRNRAVFTRATFTHDALFAKTTFSDQADFVKAAFSEEVVFIGATFAQKPVFRGATFTQPPDFTEATHAGKPYDARELATKYDPELGL